MIREDKANVATEISYYFSSNYFQIFSIHIIAVNWSI